MAVVLFTCALFSRRFATTVASSAVSIWKNVVELMKQQPYTLSAATTLNKEKETNLKLLWWLWRYKKLHKFPYRLSV